MHRYTRETKATNIRTMTGQLILPNTDLFIVFRQGSERWSKEKGHGNNATGQPTR